MCSARSLVVALLVASAFVAVSEAAFCHGHPDPNAKPNLKPIDTAAPVFVKAVPNAELWTVGTGEFLVPIVHLRGTPYQKGFAHGTLMKDTMIQMMDEVWEYLEDQVEQAINGSLPNVFSNATLQFISDFGLEAALDLTTDLTTAYTGKYYYDEMNGMADAAGVSFDKIRRIHMIGELTRGRCSMFGAWGEALLDPNGLLSLRALDWDVDGPFKKFPELTVYHAAPGSNENDFVNVGWTGWIGSITGASSAQTSIHEIGVAFPDPTFGNESATGIPFVYVLRDILQFDKSAQAGLQRLQNAYRTCDLILGVGGGQDKSFHSVQYSHDVCNIMDDKNLKPVADWHQPITNTVYHGMDWLCPGYNQVLHDQLVKFHGNLTAPLAISYITPIVQTGDLHIALTDLVNMQLYYSGAAADGSAMAYDRQFVQIDLRALFAVQPPAISPPNAIVFATA